MRRYLECSSNSKSPPAYTELIKGTMTKHTHTQTHTQTHTHTHTQTHTQKQVDVQLCVFACAFFDGCANCYGFPLRWPGSQDSQRPPHPTPPHPHLQIRLYFGYKQAPASG